ncbi:MAG: fibronectin type III domain-containing protein, partial [Ignavibacteria bacterium]|nr:fibronectin type III domain-containing protein [Ignavibacteria bacterium]
MARNILFVLLISILFSWCEASAQVYLSGFTESQYYHEQTLTINSFPEVRIVVNAPAADKFNPSLPTVVSLFALPNGNTIEQTIGKVLKTGDDWHYDIQHIGAQTRFIRVHTPPYNLVTVYLETAQKSWPSWRSKYTNNATLIKGMVDSLKQLFSAYNPSIVLTGHSGGGSFSFGFFNAYTQIPDYISRISFLDSDYNYDNTYGAKLATWLSSSSNHYLSVIAYNDSVALLNGQPVVSATGGTWYRSKMMAAYLNTTFPLAYNEDSDFITYRGLNGRISFILKQNPLQQILHTVQVEKNGYIQGMVSGTSLEGVDYTYYGNRAYTPYVQTDLPSLLKIPIRPANAVGGAQFMQSISALSFQDRENAILAELLKGNIPQFMRTLVNNTMTVTDAGGASHTVTYQVMPDYMCIGSDQDFCRVPMGPITAQKAANVFGATLPTAKLVDDIYTNAGVKLAPVTYTPVGNQNEQVAKFIEHNQAIEQQRLNAGQPLGTLVGGIKKDVILSNLIVDPSRPDHVVIYGWHQLNGSPIQPVTNIHINSYVDYSHGIRFLNNEFLLDGNVTTIKAVLSDPNLYKTLSNETASMAQPTYIRDITLPVKPVSFGFVQHDSTSVEFICQADTNIINYTVFISTNGSNYTDSATCSQGNMVIHNLQPRTMYYFRVRANNTAGVSSTSECLVCQTSANQGNVLI